MIHLFCNDKNNFWTYNNNKYYIIIIQYSHINADQIERFGLVTGTIVYRQSTDVGFCYTAITISGK